MLPRMQNNLSNLRPLLPTIICGYGPADGGRFYELWSRPYYRQYFLCHEVVPRPVQRGQCLVWPGNDENFIQTASTPQPLATVYAFALLASHRKHPARLS